MIQKFKILCIFFMGWSSMAFSQKAKVTGNISGLKASWIVFNYGNTESPHADSVAVKDGKFSWSADIPEPQKIFIMFPDRYFEFYAESGNINITGKADAIQDLKVTGSSIQDESDAYESSLKDISDQETPLYQKWGKVSEEEQVALEKKVNELREQRRARTTQYITSHPKSFFSLGLVADRAMMGAYDAVKSSFDLLDQSLQNSATGKSVAKRIEVLKRSNIGESMLNFTQNNTEGKPVQFSDFRGKYVLVDFWASWCGPCRAENPNVLAAYKKYKDKNFTVVGVSLDDDGDKWKKAIKDDGMPWTQVSDLKGWKNEVSTYYGIMGIPSTLLIDPSGKIIAKDLRGVTLNEKLAELFD